jgi:hypothetical protein
LLRTLSEGKYEVDFCGNGTFLGHEITDNGTYEVGNLDSGAVRLEGHVILNINDGSGLAAFKAFGLGKHVGPFPASNYGVMGEFPKANGPFQRLKNAACVVEYKVDADESYRWDAYEWTA